MIHTFMSVQWQNLRNNEKINNNVENEQNQYFFEWLKKRQTKWAVHKRWTNEIKKPVAHISTQGFDTLNWNNLDFCCKT